MTFSETFMGESRALINELNCSDMEKIAETLSLVRERG